MLQIKTKGMHRRAKVYEDITLSNWFFLRMPLEIEILRLCLIS